MLSPELEDAVKAALIRILSDYHAFVDEASFTVSLNEWFEGVEKYPFVTVELVEAALDHYLYRETERSKPPRIGQFIETCRNLKVAADRKAALHALPAPPTTPIGESNLERVRQMVKAAAVKGKALHQLHARLVHLAEVTGHKLPTANGLTTVGSEWVRTEYGRARLHFREHGTLSDFKPRQPPAPENPDPTIGKPLSEIAPAWSREQERALLEEWPHLKNKRERVHA